MTTPTTIRLLMPDESVRTIDLEEYLRGVVPIEMPASWPLEALKAQAVAARSYALAMAQWSKHAAVGADLCTEVHCQAYREHRETPTTDEAVRQTAGQLLRYQGPVALYQGRIAYTHFSAGCGGHTLDSEAWLPDGKVVPYLRGVPCPCGMPVKGKSHRVGMCQHGAEAMARDGATYDRILAHYYRDTVLDPPTPLSPAEPSEAQARLTVDSPLLGPPSGRQEQLARYLKRTLPPGHEYTPQDVDLILGYYWQHGTAAGVDPFLAVVQSIYDSAGWQSPAAARPYRNPAHLGQGRAPGGVRSFASWEEAVRAHVSLLQRDGEAGKRLRDLHGADYARCVVEAGQRLMDA